VSDVPTGGGRRLFAARGAALAGALWGIAGNAYIVAGSVDETIPSFLQNPSARHDDIVYALTAAAAHVVALAALTGPRVPHVARTVVAAMAAVAALSLTGEAIVLSAQPNALVALVALALPPFALLVLGSVTMALDRGRRSLAVGLLVGVAVSSTVLDVFVVRDPFREAVVYLGLHRDWEVETATDNVVVDGAGNVWGVRPWQAAASSALSRQDDEGRFTVLDDRPHGWPPTIVGVDAAGDTWIASSDFDDPFEPVVEVYRDGRLHRVSPPAWRLPPLDAMAVDPNGRRFLALHSDFHVPARIVLEEHADGQWRTRATPVHVRGRAGHLDLAVDEGGRVWVWHEGEPDRVHVLDGDRWSVPRLEFDAAPIEDLGRLTIRLDTYEAFVRGADDRLWMFDRHGGRLVELAPDGSEDDAIVLPEDCTPMALDHARRVWCGGGSGVRIADAGGTVLYDSGARGLPQFRVESLSVGPDTAWLRVARGDARQLLRFDHVAALG
jgi:sugar lactone lactonase YvrE